MKDIALGKVFDSITLGVWVYMDKSKLDKPLYCKNCGIEYLVKRFRTQLPKIVDYCRVEEFKRELQLLYKAEEMYRLYPESKKKMTPYIKLSNNEKLNFEIDIEIPTEEEIQKWTDGDSELKEFLLSSFFSIEPRRKLINNELTRLENIKPVLCPECKNGIICFKKGRLQEYTPKFVR